MTALWFNLLPHPAAPSRRVASVRVNVVRNENDLRLRYVVDGADHLVIPSPGPSERADELWRTTCFELFLSHGAGQTGYDEFNLAPSGRWAAYRFGGYRSGMTPLAVDHPPIITTGADEPFMLEARMSFPLEGDVGRALGLSAVIEERGETKSFWALAHRRATPDFHDPDCFIASLPAPTGA